MPSINSGISSLSYKLCQPDNPKSWDGQTNPIFMFGQTSSQEIDVNNIKILLSHISNFISNRVWRITERKTFLSSKVSVKSLSISLLLFSRTNGTSSEQTLTTRSSECSSKMSSLTKSPLPTKEKRLTHPLPPNWQISLNFHHPNFLLGY